MMESIKKVEDSLADFRKELKDNQAKFTSLENQNKMLEGRRDGLSKEVSALEDKKRTVSNDIQEERKSQIAEIEAKLKEAEITRRRAQDELNQAKSEVQRIRSREEELKTLIPQYEAERNTWNEKNKILAEKLKRLGEIAVG